MNKFNRFLAYMLLGTLALTASISAFAAENFDLWGSATFTPPYTDGVVAVSQTIPNGAYDSVMVTILYEDIQPVDGQAVLTAVLEREVSDGVWVPVASQFKGIKSVSTAPTRVLNLSPVPNFNEGIDNVVVGDVPAGARISSTFGVLPDTFRIVLRVTDSVATPLQSVTVSGNGQKF